jgi:hypothetical protein
MHINLYKSSYKNYTIYKYVYAEYTKITGIQSNDYKIKVLKPLHP